jgi:hypothetical protein
VMESFHFDTTAFFQASSFYHPTLGRLGLHLQFTQYIKTQSRLCSRYFLLTKANAFRKIKWLLNLRSDHCPVANRTSDWLPS